MGEVETAQIWQVEVGGQIYEADADELPSWVADGSLRPDDKVRKANLRWIEAGKVPFLMPLFDANAVLPLQSRSRAGTPVSAAPKVTVKTADHGIPFSESAARDLLKAGPAAPNTHSDPAWRSAHFKGSISQGFGMADFVSALTHPLQFKVSLFFGAVMFTAFSLGQSVSALSGMFLFAASMTCLMLANMLTFGVLANTVEKFSRGDIYANFMPDFEDFSVWDDVVQPFILSVGVYLISFGAFMVVLLGGFYLVSSAAEAKMNAIRSQVEKIPGTHYYAAKDTLKQSDDVREVLARTQQQNNERLQLQNDIANGNTNTGVVDEESKQQEELLREANAGTKASLEAVLGKTAETREQENREIFQGLLALPAPLVIVGAIALLWGLFYFPVACIVAGYTRSFASIVDPLVGLDTIKRLGATYAKVLIMGLCLLIAAALVAWAADGLFAAFYLPGMGNLPARAVCSFFGFYVFVVFSCVIGYSMFKCSDRLQLPR